MNNILNDINVKLKKINVNDKQKRKYMISKSKIRSIHSSLAIEANSLSLFDVSILLLSSSLSLLDTSNLFLSSSSDGKLFKAIPQKSKANAKCDKMDAWINR